jgi:hypothetical protein
MPAGVLFCAADMDAISPPRRRLSSQLPFLSIVSFSLGRRLDSGGGGGGVDAPPHLSTMPILHN